jgi:imidazolonepropionase-like amidohydrolase
MMRWGIRQGIAAMEQVSRVFVREFAERGVRLLVGQDGADPGGTIAEMRWLNDWGVSAAEILKGATIYPAQWLGVEDRLGSICPGKQANLLVVEGNPLEDIAQMEAAVLVIQSGEVVFRRPTTAWAQRTHPGHK